MNEKYDAVVCGTGLAECILSGLLSQERKSLFYSREKGASCGQEFFLWRRRSISESDQLVENVQGR